MQLKLQRSQRMGGLAGGQVFFCLDVRADYSAEERSNIGRYRLGPQVIYNSEAAKRHLANSGAQLDRTGNGHLAERAAGLARGALSLALAKMSLNVSIGSLAKGHHIECKDLQELLDAEDTLREACKGLTRYLEAAATFDGSEVVIEYERGEERVHIAQNAPPLIEYAAEDRAAPVTATRSPPTADDIVANMGRDIARIWKHLVAYWLSSEAKAVSFCAAKGWPISAVLVRAVSVTVTLLVVTALFVLL